ncbi:MAG: 50S ribosomal protein L29 [Thermomicrobiales bacterium]|jgi:large subunit ribosomal protein L29|nr:50S ribosomal protein L29 [Thermomicrobiales bacterium]MCC6943277.1 50S ribosomal protein L29 [Thermomicrobiales bacterium]
MKPSQVRALSEAQIETTLTELHEEWRNLRFQEAVGQLTDNARIRTIRKDIARILTVQHERRIDAAIQAELERSNEDR